MGNRLLPENLNAGGKEITPLENYEKFFNAVYEKIDQIFSTNQAPLYTEEGKSAKSSMILGFFFLLEIFLSYRN